MARCTSMIESSIQLRFGTVVAPVLTEKERRIDLKGEKSA